FRTLFAAGTGLTLAVTGLGLPWLRCVLPEASAKDGLPTCRLQSKWVAANVEELRKRYPLMSIRERLDYESSGRDPARPGPEPRLTQSSRKRLKELEEHYGRKMNTIRAESLRLLHSNQVDEFVKAEGFGVSRMPALKPSPEHLDYP